MSPLCEGCLGAGIQRPATAVSGICPASSDGSSGGMLGDGNQFDFLSQVGASHLRVEPPCFKFDADTIDRMSAAGRLDSYMDTAKAAWASYYAVLQSVSRASSTVASSAASVASSYASSSAVVAESVPSVKPVSFKKKRDKLFQMVGKRRNTSPKPIEDGYCYLHAIREGARDRVSAMLGSWPTVSSLVNQVSVADVLPIDQLRHIGVSYADARVHVTPGASTCNFFSFLATIRGLADSSFGLLKLADGCVAYDPVHLACNIGGEIPDWLSFAQKPRVSVIEVDMSSVQRCSVQGFQSLNFARVKSGDYISLLHGQSLTADRVLIESRDVDVLVRFDGNGIVAGISQDEIASLDANLFSNFEDDIYTESLRPFIVDDSSVKVLKAGINSGLNIRPNTFTVARSGFDVACEVGFSRKSDFVYGDQYSLLFGPRLTSLVLTECLTLLPGLSCSVTFAPGAGIGFSPLMLRETVNFQSFEQDFGYE